MIAMYFGIPFLLSNSLFFKDHKHKGFLYLAVLIIYIKSS